MMNARLSFNFFLSKTRIVVSAFIICHASCSNCSYAQSPYTLKTGREITLLGVGVASLGGSVALGHTVDPLTSLEINALNANDVNKLDRQAIYHYSTMAGRLSNGSLAGSIALTTALTVGTKTMRQDAKTVAVMYVETMLITNGVKGIVKAVTQRVRPFVYNPGVPLDQKMERDARQSFFSGHASNAFATAVFTGEVFRHYFPHSRLKPVVWIGSLGLATTTAVLRYEAGLHYPTDLLAGAAFGTLVGWGIPKLHEIKNQSDLGRRLDVQPWSNGSANGIYVRLLVFSQ